MEEKIFLTAVSLLSFGTTGTGRDLVFHADCPAQPFLFPTAVDRALAPSTTRQPSSVSGDGGRSFPWEHKAVSALVALAPLSSSLQTFLCFPVSWGCPALPRSSEGFQGLKHSQPTNEDLFPWTG